LSPLFTATQYQVTCLLKHLHNYHYVACRTRNIRTGLLTQSQTQEGPNFQESKWDFQESWSNFMVFLHVFHPSYM